MTTKTMKTSDLIGPALDWAVAKCEGHRGVKVDLSPDLRRKLPPRIWVGSEANKPLQQGFYCPSSNWSQGGPIIEREGIDLFAPPMATGVWLARVVKDSLISDGGRVSLLTGSVPHEVGFTALVAAMRCLCAAKFGDTVDIPGELCQ